MNMMGDDDDDDDDVFQISYFFFRRQQSTCFCFLYYGTYCIYQGILKLLQYYVHTVPTRTVL